jgi:hypothetical protein
MSAFTNNLLQPSLLGNGLVGWWKMDEGQGLTAYDTSGKNKNGTLINSPAWTTGIKGNCLLFNGTGSCVENTKGISISTIYTVTAWINPADLLYVGHEASTYGGAIMASSGGSGDYPLWLTVYGTEIRIASWEGSITLTPTSGSNLHVNNWYFISAVGVKGGNTSVYVNGINRLSYTNHGQLNWANEFCIGDVRLNRNISFNGLIDDVRIYNRALSQQEITLLYNSYL